MNAHRSVVLFVLFQLLLLSEPSDGWRRRRRRRRCYPRNCVLSSWGSWSSCSRTCGSFGRKTRYRRVLSYAYCGGWCYSTSQSTYCPGTCCPISCSYSWTSWSSCSATCMYGTRTRRTLIWSNPSCGGSSCPRSPQSQNCGNGRCCPVNCVVGSWGSWGACNAACERSGTKTRTRPVTTRASCGGTACPSTSDSQPCQGPCCPRNCVVSPWSAWSKCSSSSCATNSGTQSRTRRITTQKSCGGSCSQALTGSQRCTPIPVTCQVSSWNSWAACVATNGRCGGGSQTRTRRITRQSYCSSPCPATTESRSCIHSCCPVDCQVSTWTAWSTCSSTCGQGKSDRTRTVRRPASCGGQACGSLSDSKVCTQYINTDCQMGPWSSWSICDNGCGQGLQRKTRNITRQPVCLGTKCGAVEAFEVCYDYRNNRNCQVGLWTSWGKCDQTCAVGNKVRTRVITQNQQCRGRTCPALKESTQCGSPNNGCQHQCTNGICSCNAGYNLFGSKQCVAKDCGQLSLSYCAPGTQLGTTCKHADVFCPRNQTSYPVTCSIFCPSTYTLKGVSSVTCTTAGTWTSTTSTYCRRINDPPTQILLSGSHSIAENQPRNTLVGVLTSVDPNSRDSHRYSLISGGEGKFTVIGDEVHTTVVFDYETMNKRYDLTVRSIDNGNPSLFVDSVITITLNDVNEKPTDIQLSNHYADENSDIDTIVGVLSTTDPDTKQSHSYSIIDTASGRFKIDGKTVKVAISHDDCLQNGGDFCKLNFEDRPSHQITVQSLDNGYPALSIIVTLTINLTDVNDQPRGLRLSGNTVMENAASGKVIGKFTADDEDIFQRMSYNLSDNDQGRFSVSHDGYLTKVLPTVYDKDKVHLITVAVQDNGDPRKKMEKVFSIQVLDINEPPVSIHLSNERVNENSTIGTVVGTLSARDDGYSRNLTFKLDNTSLPFSLTSPVCKYTKKGTTCTAILKVDGPLNHEVGPVLKITVRVTDQDRHFKIQTFNITVIDNNDRPGNVTISGGLEASIAENSPRAFVGELATSDEDGSQKHRYNLLSSSDIFEVRKDRFLYLKDKSLDFEQKNKYVVMVTSTDDGSPAMTSAVQSLTVHVTDRNEAPVKIVVSNLVIPENSVLGTAVGNLAVTDPDNYGNFSARQSHVCRLTDSAQGKFKIVLKNGQNVLTQAVNSLDYEQANAHRIQVLCTDPLGLSNERDFDVIVSDVNEAPLKVTLSNKQVSENSGAAAVGVLTTQDPDNANNQSKQRFTYSVTNGPSPFSVNGNVLSTTRGLNYENARTWTVVVRAQDDGNPPQYRDESFVIDVLDGNDRPSGMQLSNLQVKENSDVDTVIGNLTTNDEDKDQDHLYKLIDSAGGRFKIDGRSVKVAISNTLCLRYGNTSCLLNFEAQSIYNITVRATDNGIPAKHFDKTFTVYLNDDNDRPRDLRLSRDTIPENATMGTVIGSFTARDEDRGQKLSFSLINDDGGRFALNGNNLVTANSLDHEADKRHVVTVVVVDNGYNALKLERNFTIKVLSINETPVTINFTHAQSTKVFENTTTGSTVGTLFALHHDANQVLNFTLDDDSQGEFSLETVPSQCQSVANERNKTRCTAKLLLSKPLNYEFNSVRFITVRVTDTHGLFHMQKFTMSVLDCNDAPTNITLNGGVSAVVYENVVGALVGELQTSDEDRWQSWTYQLSDDFGKFVIFGKYIYINSASYLNHEEKPRYILSVSSIDSGFPASGVSRNFTIVVADVNEAPTKITLSAEEIFENSAPGTIIANLMVEDPDNLVRVKQNHACVVVRQNKFRIDSGRLVSSVELNFEKTSSFNIAIECTDSGRPRLKYQQDFTIVVKGRNEAPSDIVLSSLSVLENQKGGVIASISTIDPDNEASNTRQSFSYQLRAASKDFPFQIRGHNLETTRALNYEAIQSWKITIESSDNGQPSLSIDRTFVISVHDINEAASNINLSPSNVRENPEEGLLVGRLAASDQDIGQTHQFALLDSASGRFKLVNNSEIRIAISNANCRLHGGKSCLFNYENQKVHSIRVLATDDGSPPKQLSTSINITLDDINDQPRDLALSKHWVLENEVVGSFVAYLSAYDEDNQTLNYSLVQSDQGLFGVKSNGELFVAQPLNHEQSSIEHMTVRVTDNGDPEKSMEKQFTIVIENAEEAPFNISLNSLHGQLQFNDDQPRVNENSAIRTVVGTVVSLDEDVAQYLNFALDDDAGGRFSVSKTTTCHNGTSDPHVKTVCSCELLVSGKLNYEEMPSHLIIVEVSDGNHSRVNNFTVALVDQNDRPENVTIQGSLSGRVKENANDALIGELVTGDEDVSQTHVYALKDASRFALKGNKLYTAQEANLNYEEQQEFKILVHSTDDGKPPLNIEQNLTVTVEDVNESPNNITLSNLTIPENSQPGSFVANITIDDPDNHGPNGVWQTHTCGLIESAQDRFKVLAGTKTLVVSTGDLNHELSNTHTIILKCTDSGSKPLSIEQSFTIQVLDVNEKPRQILLSNYDVQENGGALFVGHLSTRDPDKAQSFVYTLLSANEEDVFYINGSQLRTYTSLNYENRSSWDLMIKTMDQGGLNFTQNFKIIVRDTNDPPSDIFSSIPLVVSENSNLHSTVSVFNAVDEDAGQLHRFFITTITAFGYGSNSVPGYRTAFDLDPISGKLMVASPIDYEIVTRFTLGIMTQDEGDPQFTFNKTFTLKVLDVNEPPSDLELDYSQIPENSAVNSVVGNLSVTDPDNVNEETQFYTCEVVNNVPFKVLHMQLLVKEAFLDFEKLSHYSVKINCSENGNSTYYIYRSFPIRVTDINEAPYDLTLNGTSVKEHQPTKTPVGTLFASDEDRKDTVTFALAADEDSSKFFVINGNSLLTSEPFNFEEKNNYVIKVIAKDDGKPSLNQTKEFTIQILDINDRPVAIRFNSSGVYENAAKGTVVGKLITDDPDKDNTHVYTLLHEKSAFSISGDELLVNQFGILDYENQASVTIVVETTDNGKPRLSATENITVQVHDSNDRPTDIKTTTSSVNENTQGDTPVQFKVKDQDRIQSHTCDVRHSEFFDIANSRKSSILRVKSRAVLDYEKTNSISIIVTCSDNGHPSLSITKPFDIKINDVNEAPVDISILNGSYEISEIASFNYSLGSLNCTDPDFNQSCSFEILGHFFDTFNVTKPGNLLTVNSNKKLDYEKLNSPTIQVRVRATDDGEPKRSFNKTLNITVQEVNEGASEISLNPDGLVLKETTPPGTNISELVCNNPEKWQTVEYALSSYYSIFEVVKVPYNASYPVMTRFGVKQVYKSFLFLKSFLNYNIEHSYDILVNVTDNGQPPKSFADYVHVNVSKVDPCLPNNTCHENASCQRIDGFEYSCTCKNGFTGDGKHCTNIDDCANSKDYCNDDETTTCPPCKNDATCHDGISEFNCTCLPGYDGLFCGHNINECEQENFKYSCNEGHSDCVDGVNDITCDCYRGFTGRFCNTNIDDCFNEPCGSYGTCTDHIGSYECKCKDGYSGSRCERCQRKSPCTGGEIYVPYPTNSGEDHCEEPEKDESGSTSKGDLCFSDKNATTLYFDIKLGAVLESAGVELNETVTSAMRIEVEDWLKKITRVYYVYAASFNEEGDYNLSDVSVLDGIEVSSSSISVRVVARVGRKALSRTGFLCSLRQTHRFDNCSNINGYPSYTSKEFSFVDFLCPTIEKEDWEKLDCKSRDTAESAFTGSGGSELPRWSMYLLGGLGLALFVFVVLFACYADRSQKFNLRKALLNREQYDHVRLPDEDDDNYRDAMFRHHISTSGGAEINPVYGFDEDESQMHENPLYGTSRGVDSPLAGHSRSFENPLHSLFEREPGLHAKPVGHEDESSSN